MAKKIKAALTAILQIILFILIPIVFLKYLPADMINMLKAPAAFDIQNMTLNIIIIGLVIVILTFIKNTTSEFSMLNLLSSISLQLAELYLFLFFVGLGNPWSFGKTATTFDVGAPVNVTFDLQLFAVASIAIIAMKVGIIVLNFSKSKTKK